MKFDLKPETTLNSASHRFCVAPMLDWTDRHFRYFARGLSRHTRLYTEMITTGALLHGDALRFLRHDDCEHPLALQLGGSDPLQLAQCAHLAEEAGMQEVNLNTGCPSDRVQNNRIGACLMAEPKRVADCIHAMKDATSLPVTLKHRIGIDGHDSYEELRDFVGQAAEAGCDLFIVHARIAILSGLSPKQNREIPPLRYEVAERLVLDFPDCRFVLNGGISSLPQCLSYLEIFDGVMLGRAAYHDSYLLAGVDATLFGENAIPLSRYQAIARMRPYLERHLLEDGARLHQVTRHLLGIAQGFSSARRFRRLLSEETHRADSSEKALQLFDQALALLENY